ncbi:MAG: hypothetical protein Q8L55_04560 [Phycisphaerales bacterium]|nr:hypothetical protein [Phycisphaerales bacterium]
MLTFNRSAASVFAAAILAVSCPAALAQVQLSGYIADTYTTFAPFGNTLGQYNDTVSGTGQRGTSFDSFFPGAPSRHASAVSGGGPGYVNGYAFSQYIANTSDGNPGSYYMRAESNVESTWSDIVVSPIGGGGGGGLVPFSVNLLLHGSYGFTTSNAVDPHNVGWSQYSAASFAIWVNGVGESGNWLVSSDRGGPVTNPLGNGFFANFNGTFNGSTATVMVPVNTPFSIRMFLQVNAQVSVPSGGSVVISTSTDFAHTASFATSGPAFNLPEGYTVNSAQAGVVDNTFILTPTPGAFGLLSMAGAAALGRGRRSGAAR